jgi:hypothetical protein
MKNHYIIKSGGPNEFCGVSTSGVQLFSLFWQFSCTQNIDDIIHPMSGQFTTTLGKTGFSDLGNDCIDQFCSVSLYIL